MSQPDRNNPLLSDIGLDEIQDAIENDKKLLLQKSVTELTQREYEDQMLGGRIARFGAYVCAIEPMQWDMGMGKLVEGRLRLGRYIKSEEFNDAIKVTFTTPDGLFYPNSDAVLPTERRVEHPLSKIGFYIPKEGGWLTGDEGWLLLVSPTGLFAGRGGWEKARELYGKWSYEVNQNHQYHERLQAVTNQLKHSEDQMMILQASKEDFQLWAIEQQQKYLRANDVLLQIKEINMSLQSQVESLSWTKSHQDNVIKKELTDLDNAVREVTMLVFNDKIDEQLRQASSKIPDMSPYMKNRFMNNLKRGNMVQGDMHEQVIEKQKKQIEDLTSSLEALKKQIEEGQKGRKKQEPKDKPVDDGEEVEEDDDRFEKVMSDEGQEESDNEPQEKEQKKDEQQKEQPQPDKPKKGLGFLKKIGDSASKVAQEAKENVGKAVAKEPKEEEAQDTTDEGSPAPEESEQGDNEEIQEDEDE